MFPVDLGLFHTLKPREVTLAILSFDPPYSESKRHTKFTHVNVKHEIVQQNKVQFINSLYYSIKKEI